MKRILITVLVFSLLLLSGCSEFSSRESRSLYNDIEELRDMQISTKDMELLQDLDYRYLKLPRKHQEEIKNYNLLEKAYEDLKKAEAAITDLNDRIAFYEEKLPPESLAELTEMRDTYSALAPEDQLLVKGNTLQQLYEKSETAYGENSLYARLNDLNEQGAYKDAVALTDEVLAPGAVSGTVMPYYGELLGTCSINYLDQLVTAGETRQLLESFNEDAFIKFTDEQQTAFAGTVLPVYEQQAKELADAKDYDGAIALIDTLWQVLPEKAPSDGLSESAGTCFCAKAKALYNKKSYEDAAAVCKQGVGYHIDLPTEADRELAGIYTDASLAQADKLLKAKKYKDAYDYLQGVQLSAMTADQRTKVQDKRDAVLKAAKPKNGAVLERNVGSGYNQFTIEAGSRDALVKIESTKDPAKYVLFYVHANKSATVKVSQGSYTVKYVTGDNYIDKEHTFMSGASYAKADRVYDLKVTYSGNYVNYDVVTITLYTVLFGNLETSTISPSEF